MSEPHRIRYRFDLPDGSQKTLDFTFDPGDFRLANPAPAVAPEPAAAVAESAPGRSQGTSHGAGGNSRRLRGILRHGVVSFPALQRRNQLG